MKTINKANNQQILLDDEIYESLKGYSYRINGQGYVEVFKRINLHRFIMNTPKGMVTDHINGNKLDNRKSNLRICKQIQNTRNTKPRSASGYKGVYPLSTNKSRWVAQIRVSGKDYFLGVHETKESAARAYDKAAKKYFGKYAWLNFAH